MRKSGSVGSWNELGHGGSYLGWTKTNFSSATPLELRVPETGLNCFPQTFLQIQLACVNWYASKSEHVVKKPLLKICPIYIYIYTYIYIYMFFLSCILEKMPPFPSISPTQQPRPPSRCIVANKCTASVHIIAAPQDDMARWYATLSGMRSRPGWATKPCKNDGFRGCTKIFMVPMHSHLYIELGR